MGRQVMVGRQVEWGQLERFSHRGPGFGVVYGSRRVGKSFLLQQFADHVGGWRYQAVGGTERVQLDDFGAALGAELGVGSLRLNSWSDALARLDALGDRLVVIDEYPYLRDGAPEIDGRLQRYVDANRRGSLIVCGSAVATMGSLLDRDAPLFGRASMVLVPEILRGGELARLWEVDRPEQALWVDAAMGGFPGYRPLLDRPQSLDQWMVHSVLASSSPVLDAAEASLRSSSEPVIGTLARSILGVIAAGERTRTGIARHVGVATTALSRPLVALERAGMVRRVRDLLRTRRDRYELGDPHLGFWLAMVAPYRSHLQAGRAESVWSSLCETTWPSQVLGPRWEQVVRAHLTDTWSGEGVIEVGVTSVSDPQQRVQHELDLVVTDGGNVVALGESKLRRLGARDADRLRHIRSLMGADDAMIILASAAGADAGVGDDVMAVTPADLYAM